VGVGGVGPGPLGAASDIDPAPSAFVVATTPSSLAVSASFSPSTSHTGRPAPSAAATSG